MSTNKYKDIIIMDEITGMYKASPTVEAIHGYHDCKIPLPKPSHNYQHVYGQIFLIIKTVYDKYKHQFKI